MSNERGKMSKEEIKRNLTMRAMEYHMLINDDEEDNEISNKKVIAIKNDWKTEEMPIESESIELIRNFSETDLFNLSFGHIPQQMEDKWFWYVDDNKLYAHRSWTGFCIFILELNTISDIHKVIINRKKEQYSSTSIQTDLEMINSLLNYWIKPKYDYYMEWLDETLNNINKTDLVNKYLEIKEKHDKEFLKETGGDSNQELRDKKREQYEVPLLEKMTEDELHEVMKNLSQFEKKWITDRFINQRKTTIVIKQEESDKKKLEKEDFYCEVYQEMISEYDCSEISNGGPVLNDGLPPLMEKDEIAKRSYLCKTCIHNPDPNEYDPLWNGDDLMKDKEDQHQGNTINEQKPISKTKPTGLSPDDIFLYNIKVAGTTYINNKDTITRKLNINDSLALVREPDNKYDKYAIKVLTSKGEKIGYIPRENNKIFARMLDAGKELYLIIQSIQEEQYSISTWLFLKEK